MVFNRFKKIKGFIILALFLGTGFLSEAQFRKATLQASGLTCAMCNNAINKALKGLAFVNTVKSDTRNASFDIVFKEGTEVDIDAMRKAVEDAGFFVSKLRLTGNFDNLKIKNDEHVMIGDEKFHFLQVNDQVLNGEQTLTVLDKNFLTAKEFKKIKNATKMDCLQTGKEQNTRIYHVTI